uniref:Syntaxin-binding protein 4 n=1 Tax=Prolemur simus TaxID=1328070 RepID=A0A8C9DIK3_PROSS
MYKNTSAVVSSSLLEKDPAFQMITITKETGLGLKILGGINRNEGPLVYIQEIIPGGDCYKDGRLKPGDQLVSVNKESMIGVSFEEAKRIITRAKLRSESTWEIAFIRQKCDSNYPEKLSCTSLLEASGEYGPQASTFSLLSSPPEILIPKTSSTPKINDAILPSYKISQIKTGYNKTEQTPITSSDNSTTDMSNTDVAPAWTDNYGLQGKKISLNPSVRLKTEKLEMALNYLGIQPTKEQHQSLRQQVQTDSEGTVAFGDFVQVAKNLFCLQLDEINVGAHEISNILDSQFPEMEIFLYRFIRNMNSDLAKINVVCCVSSTLCYCPHSERRAVLASKTSLISLGRNGRNIPATLALESKELVKSVRAILDMDCLPYGWEEAYTADGIKYFINHVTQTTSWIHPVMSVLNLSCSEENEEDCSREPPDQKS